MSLRACVCDKMCLCVLVKECVCVGKRVCVCMCVCVCSTDKDFGCDKDLRCQFIGSDLLTSQIDKKGTKSDIFTFKLFFVQKRGCPLHSTKVDNKKWKGIFSILPQH